MISACELHEKVIAKEIAEEMAKQLKIKETSEEFIEKVISPLVDSLTEMPKDYLIGYWNIWSPIGCEYLYKSFDSKPTEIPTSRGWTKLVRYYGDCLFFEKIDAVDFDYINTILAEYGFKVELGEGERFEQEYFYCGQRSYYAHYKRLYLNTLCPLI